MNLSYVAEPPIPTTSGSNLNHRFKVKRRKNLNRCFEFEPVVGYSSSLSSVLNHYLLPKIIKHQSIQSFIRNKHFLQKKNSGYITGPIFDTNSFENLKLF